MAVKKKETKSKFYVVNTLKEARGKVETRAREKVDAYKKKFVKQPIASGKEFLSELRADPVKTIDDLIDDGRDALKKAKEERYDALKKNIENVREKTRSRFDKLGKEARTRMSDRTKRFDKINKEGRKVVKGIEKDARLVMEDIKDMGKKKLDKLPLKKTLEKKISKGLESIPSKFNLPSKTEIDNLVSGIDGVSKKVDALTKQTA